MKKALALLIASLMVLSSLPFGVFAEEFHGHEEVDDAVTEDAQEESPSLSLENSVETTESFGEILKDTKSEATSGYYTYTVNGYEATITDVDTAISGSITIPSYLGGYQVTTIGGYAFFECTSITSLTIPAGVKSLDSYAFRNCTGLTELNLNANVSSINTSSPPFAGCTRLATVRVGSGVKSIPSYMFNGLTGIKTVTLGSSVETIGYNAFSGCTGLTRVTYCGTSDQWSKISIGSNNTPLTSASRYYHSYNAATCTKPKTCTLCGTTSGSSLGHRWLSANCTTPSTCSVCGVTTGDVKHVWLAANCSAPQTCSVCGKTTGNAVPTAHVYDNACDNACNLCGGERIISHNFSVQEKNTTLHWKKCSVCGEIDESTREAHIYDNACDTACNVCGETRTITHNFSTQDKNATLHWMKCSVCGKVNEDTLAAHAYDNACDTTCNVCFAERSITHDFSVQGKNDVEHWMQCFVCGAIDETTRAAHIHDNACDTTCNVCGQVRVITHEFSIQDKDAETHWMKCSVCGEIDESTREAHVYDNACDTACNVCLAERSITHDFSVQEKNTNLHWMKCSVCGKVDENTLATHIHDNACDSTCNVCGEERITSHDFSTQDKSASAHWMKCSVCGKMDELTLAVHVYDNVCDANCNVCGEERTPSDHAYDNDRDLICNECGFEREPLYTPGDLDGVEGVTSADAIYLLYYTLFGEARYPINQPVDYDGNGTVNSADAIYLLYHTLFGASRYPL